MSPTELSGFFSRAFQRALANFSSLAQLVPDSLSVSSLSARPPAKPEFGADICAGKVRRSHSDGESSRHRFTFSTFVAMLYDGSTGKFHLRIYVRTYGPRMNRCRRLRACMHACVHLQHEHDNSQMLVAGACRCSRMNN